MREDDEGNDFEVAMRNLSEAEVTRWRKKWRTCRLTGCLGVGPMPGIGVGTGAANPVEEAHILPRRLCTPWQAKDPNNLLLLYSPIHKYFDSALLTFSPSGRVLVDRHVPEFAVDWFAGKTLDGYTREEDRYMEFHRIWVGSKGFEPR